MEPATISLDVRLRHSPICRRFDLAWQAGWKSGQRPRIQDYLREVPASEQDVLLRELLLLELECRRAHGEQPCQEEYERRFPARAPVIAAFSIEIPHYALDRRLGQGRYGTVYLARHRNLNTLHAIKIPHSKSTQHTQACLTEAKRQASLNHPAIVRVNHADVIDSGGCFFAMEYIEGKSLHELIKDRRENFWEPREAVRLVADVADGLQHAHDRSIIHRDLKPANILIDRDGKPHITDFGVSLDRFGLSFHKGELAGTPAYRAPEQWHGHGHDGKADVYAIGVILYELLTGHRPFVGVGEDLSELHHRVLENDPVAPRTINPRIDEELERLCLRSLEKGAAQRPTAGEFATELGRWLQRDALEEHLPSYFPRPGKTKAIGIPDTAPGISNTATSLAFHPERTILIAGCEDGTVQFWNFEQNAEMTLLGTGHQNRVTSVAFSPDGKMFASSSLDKQIYLWNTSWDGRPPLCRVLKGHNNAVMSVCFSHNGQRLFSAGRDGIKSWDVTNEHVEEIEPGNEWRVVAASQQRIVAGGKDGRIRVRSVSSGEPQEPIVAHDGRVTALAFRRCGDILASAGRDSSIKLWGLRQRQAACLDVNTIKEEVPARFSSASLAFSADMSILVSGDNRKRVRVFDVSQFQIREVESMCVETAIESIAFSPIGNIVAFSAAKSADKRMPGGTLYLWNLSHRCK